MERLYSMVYKTVETDAFQRIHKLPGTETEHRSDQTGR